MKTGNYVSFTMKLILVPEFNYSIKRPTPSEYDKLESWRAIKLER